jgi:hypothetical protein
MYLSILSGFCGNAKSHFSTGNTVTILSILEYKTKSSDQLKLYSRVQGLHNHTSSHLHTREVIYNRGIDQNTKGESPDLGSTDYFGPNHSLRTTMEYLLEPISTMLVICQDLCHILQQTCRTFIKQSLGLTAIYLFKPIQTIFSIKKKKTKETKMMYKYKKKQSNLIQPFSMVILANVQLHLGTKLSVNPYSGVFLLVTRCCY